MANRTTDLRRFLDEHSEPGDLARPRSRRKRDARFSSFSETSCSLVSTIAAIKIALRKSKSGFINKYEDLLARRSLMTEEDRAMFVQEITEEITKVRDMIDRLATDASERWKPAGDKAHHVNGTIQCLRGGLSDCILTLHTMKQARKSVRPPARRTVKAPSMLEWVDPDLLPDFQEQQQVLAQRYSRTSRAIVETERQVAEIATLQRLYLDLIAGQTETIIAVREDLEIAQTNYEDGAEEIDQAARSSKKWTLVVSGIIVLLGLLLLMKAG